MLKIFLIATALAASSLSAYALTCNGEARDTCERKGGTWNSSNCTCS